MSVNYHLQEKSQYGITPIWESFGSSKARVPCQFLHFAKTEDIWLKSALKVERSVLLTSGRKREDRGGKKKRERRF
jgi:hypothetical protein